MQGLNPRLLSIMSPAVAGELFTNSATWESQIKYKPIKINSKVGAIISMDDVINSFIAGVALKG